MPVFMIQRCVVKPEKHEEYRRLLQRFMEYKKQNPKLSKEVKSLRIFRQRLGDLIGAYIEMWEFDSMADLEKCEMRGSQNKNSENPPRACATYGNCYSLSRVLGAIM